MIKLNINKVAFFLGLLTIYFLLSLGQFLYAIKFNVPWFGTEDFASYYQMAKNPLNHSVETPWHSTRILTPLIAWFFWQINFYIKTTDSPFIEGFKTLDGVSFDENILFALIASNYFGLLFSAVLIFYILYLNFQKNSVNLLLLILFSLLIFLSPFNNFSVLTGVTEGVSILIISLILYAISRKNYLLYFILIILSVFQRELIPLLIFFIIIFLPKSDFGIRWKLLPMIAFMLASLRILMNVNSSPLNINYSEKLAEISSDLSLHNIIFSLLFLNLFLIYISLVVFNRKKCYPFSELLPLIFYFLSLVVLYFLQSVGLQNLIRMFSLANPYLIILIVGQIRTLLRKSEHEFILISKDNSFI
jgi:hypothetical protein